MVWLTTLIYYQRLKYVGNASVFFAAIMPYRRLASGENSKKQMFSTWIDPQVYYFQHGIKNFFGMYTFSWITKFGAKLTPYLFLSSCLILKHHSKTDHILWISWKKNGEADSTIHFLAMRQLKQVLSKFCLTISHIWVRNMFLLLFLLDTELKYDSHDFSSVLNCNFLSEIFKYI